MAASVIFYYNECIGATDRTGIVQIAIERLNVWRFNDRPEPMKERASGPWQKHKTSKRPSGDITA